MTAEKRAKLLKLLSSSSMVRLTTYGCGSRSQLAYRVESPTSSLSCIYDQNGRKLSGQSVPDEMLLKHVKDTIDELSTFLGDDS